MLEIQKYLKSGKTLADLKAELGINSVIHPELPLVILNYDQIDSPKTNPLVRECRGLTLNTENWGIVSKSFPRFFNWGEVADEMPLFDWNTCVTQEKVDGSLVNIYYFDGEWRLNTRGSFANLPIFGTEWEANYFKMPQSFTWKEAIMQGLNIKDTKELNPILDKSLSYSVEFCSLWNKVVREYPQPCVYQLSAFVGEEEVKIKDIPLFRKVGEYSLKNANDIMSFVNDHPEATFEGVVIRDGNYRRWKIKNARYLALHHLKGNNNLWHPKHMIPFIMAGEADEILTYFPEATDVYNQYKAKIDNAFEELKVIWEQYHHLPNQKDFALAIIGKTKFTPILFQLRKQLGDKQTLADLKEIWRQSSDMILKLCF